MTEQLSPSAHYGSLLAHVLVLATIMLVAGVAGGLVGYVSRTESQDNRAWWKYVAIGVGAAFIVPLFLNTISSDLIRSTLDKTTGEYQPEELLTFVGLCLLASIFADRFLLAISNRVLQDEINEVRQENKKIARAQGVTEVIRAFYAHFDHGNYDEALEQADEWLEMRPRDSRPYIAKARVFRRKQRIDEAIGLLSEAIGLSDKYAYWGYYNRACYKALAGSYDKQSVLLDLRKSVELNPSYKQTAKQDPDFNNVLAEEDFRAL